MDFKEMDLIGLQLEGIFPVTIVKDTHDGAFCGGKYIAWFKEPNEVPSGSRSDPIEAKSFWRTYKSNAEIRNTIGICGIGNTIDAACRNLKLTLSDLGYFNSNFFTIEDDDLGPLDNLRLYEGKRNDEDDYPF